MVFFKAGFQALENQERLVYRGFKDINFLEAAGQRPILFENPSVLLVGRGTDAAQISGCQHGFDQVGGIHDAARCGTRANDGVNFVDEKYGVRFLA